MSRGDPGPGGVPGTVRGRPLFLFADRLPIEAVLFSAAGGTCVVRGACMVRVGRGLVTSGPKCV